MTDGEVPYRLTFGEGIQPTDVAWLHVTRLPMERYTELTGQEPPETTSRSISLQKTGLGERESALLADRAGQWFSFLDLFAFDTLKIATLYRIT